MVQQQINTTSITDPPLDGIGDTVILSTTSHLQGSPAISISFVPADVDTFLNLINLPAHTLFDDMAVYLHSTGTAPGGLSTLTKYYVVNSVAGVSIQLSTTLGGSAITLVDGGVGTHYVLTGLAIDVKDPWDKVLTILDLLALDPTTVVSAMDAATSPSGANPFVTYSALLSLVSSRKDFTLVGPPGSGADYEGTDEQPFNDAQTAIAATGGTIVVLPGTYTFSTTFTIGNGIRLEGLHPSLVIISSGGNFAAIQLSGVSSGIDKLQIEAPLSTTSAALKIIGQRCLVERCKITNFGFVGVQCGGFRNKVNATRFESSTALSQAVMLQNTQNILNSCSFGGTLPNGVVKIEGDACGVFASYFDLGITGYSYLMLSPSVNDTRLVGNHYGSTASLNLSQDYGTDSVRYGNTPNSFIANQNNFLVPLAEFTGQPDISASSVTLTNEPVSLILGFPFAITTDNLTDIYSELDLLIQQNFEERNYFLHSVDPTFDGLGVPLTGTFSWDGTSLTFPQFFIQSVLARSGRWVVDPDTVALPAGEVLYVDIDQSVTVADVTLVPVVAPYALALVAPADKYRLVLAVGLPGNSALWVHGWRLLTALTSFDVDGTPLPIVRFVGMTEARNPAPPFSGFSGAAQSNLTDKASAQSAHLQEEFERTNLSFEPLTNDAEFSTDPTPGAWLSLAELAGIPVTPTHLIEHQTQTYGLDPATGVYRYNLSATSWSLVPGIPLAGPYTALSYLNNGIAILKDNGQVLFFDTNALSWNVYTPALSGHVASLTPFASSRGVGFMSGGQADYALQTDKHTFFTTLDGYTVRFSLENNTLDWTPRAYTEDVGDRGLISHSLKDTGYNCLRHPDDQFESLDHGVSYTTALPVGIKGTFLPLRDAHYDEFRATDFSALLYENFACDTHSGAWMAVYRDVGSTKYYIFGGGKGTSYLYAVLNIFDPQFTDFIPHYWAVNGAKQQVIAVGSTFTSSFAVLIGSYDAPSNTWIWVNQTPLNISAFFAPVDVDAGTDTITSIGHGLQNTNQVVFTTTGTLPGGLNNVTTYFIVNATANTFQVSLTSGGAAVDILDGGLGVHTAIMVNTCKGAIAVYDYLPGGTNAGDLYVLVSNPSRDNKPSFWKRNGMTSSWTFKTLTDVVALTEDVLVAAAVANSFDYTSTLEALGGFGAVSPGHVSFLVKDDAMTGRPTLFDLDKNLLSYAGVRLADAGGDVVLAAAVANSATQLCGAVYHASSNSTYYAVKDAGTTTRLFTQHYDTGVLTVWSGFTLAAVGLSLPFTNRSSNQLCVDTSDGYNPAAVPRLAYLLTSDGISTITLTGSSTSLALTSLSSDDHVSGDTPCFSSTMISPYIAQLGAFRGGEPSVQIGTWVLDDTFATFGCGFGNDPNLGGGIFWHEPGTKVKNLGSNLWAGLNRGGYLWIADASKRTRMTELTPNPVTVRGDITVANLGTTTDFDFAFNDAGTQIAFVFADAGNPTPGQMGFILWDIATQAVLSFERASIAPFDPAGTSVCASTPRITRNAFATSWDIAVQDDSRSLGQVAFYRRPQASPAWAVETLGAGGNEVLGSMGSNSGISPSRPHIEANGDVVIASQKNAGDLLVIYRQAAGAPGVRWATSTPTPLVGGGFVAPELVESGSIFWVFGNSDGTNAKIASSLSYTSSWSVYFNSLSAGYNRVSAVKVYPFGNGDVAIASPLLPDLALTVPANQEIGVFKVFAVGVPRGKIFAAMGRLQAAFYSTEEETSFGDLSFTYDGKLLYSGLRPGRSASHYSIRVSRNLWENLGDSCLGSGRLISIGERTYREEYVDSAPQGLINEFDYNYVFQRSWFDLPIAERDRGNFTALRYPHTADGAPTLLFRTGNPTDGMVSDASLSSGSLPAVTSRDFPIICGSTRIQGGAGASVLYNGGMVTLSASYLPVVGVNGMFKLMPQDTLTIKGTFRFNAPNSNARSYTITGPLTFNLDTSTFGHLVLQFPTAVSLTLDATANPLTYWTNLDHPQATYSIVLGEVREKSFVLHPCVKMNSRVVKLTYGSLELPDITEELSLVRYCAPVSQYGINKVIGHRFLVEPTDIDSVTVKQVGSIHGLQRLDFALVDGTKHLLIAQGLPPVSEGYYFYTDTTEAVISEMGNMRIQHIVGRFGNLVGFSI